MAANENAHETFVERTLHRMVMHPGVVLAIVGVLSIVFLVGGITAAPEDEVSFNPSGEEFDTADIVEQTFRPATTELLFIIEDEDGDALDIETLREWYQNSAALRSSDELSDELSTYFDDALGVTIHGTYSIADAVDAELSENGVSGGLAEASNDQVKQALSSLLAEDRPTAGFRDRLSVHAEVVTASVGGGEIELWTSPAFVTELRVDHVAFPISLEDETDAATRSEAEQGTIDDERALEIEKYARDAQDVLRGDEMSYQAWGVAIDGTLADDEAFESALPFLIGAFALIVFLVGLLLRSYWAAALAGAGLALTMLWARMLANLVGFEESVIVDVIVPIATISFGVDFMIHAVGRCREELAGGKPHRMAYVVGMATVGGAIALAFSTSSIAFGANATSGIPGVIQFGFGAAIALSCAFVMLGLLAPLFLLRIEEGLAAAPAASGSLPSRLGAGARMLAPSLAAAVVIIAIIGVPFIGGIGTVAFIVLLIGVPYWWTKRGLPQSQHLDDATSGVNVAGQSMARAGTLVVSIVQVRYAALVVIALITAGAAVGAMDVKSDFEPKDFLPSDSDFIISIDKVLAHTESISGGDMLIFVEGNDLADPRALRSAAAVVDSVGVAGGDLFVQNADGSFAAPDNGLDVARAALAVDYARETISDDTGIVLTDQDGDGFPDTTEQTLAIFGYAASNGVPSDESTFVYTTEEVGRLLAVHDDAWATTLSFPLLGLFDSGDVADSRAAAEDGEADLQSAVSAEGLKLETSISGSALTQQLRIDAITESMAVSVPVAMVLCLIVAGLVMRSWRQSLASVIPIALVIVWLLGFMRAFDYDLNVVTATIAAISVGVGIDYSIHFTMRFREEFAQHSDRLDAIRLAAEGTGTALILSAVTSITGFALLALAPMPVLAAYGLLTAVMIALSLFASLTVLPSLLYMVTPSKKPSVNLAGE